ncbi:MAG TPA: hypothetical protein VJ111_01805 [Chitinophagaceae bacterium]|nr:hypothetical protein [Chitinophagaceae bacterium]
MKRRFMLLPLILLSIASYGQLYLGKHNLEDLKKLNHLLVICESNTSSISSNFNYQVDVGEYNKLVKTNQFTDSTAKTEIAFNSINDLINYVCNNGWSFIQMNIQSERLSSMRQYKFHYFISFKKK